MSISNLDKRSRSKIIFVIVIIAKHLLTVVQLRPVSTKVIDDENELWVILRQPVLLLRNPYYEQHEDLCTGACSSDPSAV